MRFRVLQIVSVVILMVLLQGTAGNPDSSYLPADSISYFPDTEWTATTPEEQGMNSTILDEMIQFIENESAPIKGLVVTRNGLAAATYYLDEVGHYLDNWLNELGEIVGL